MVVCTYGVGPQRDTNIIQFNPGKFYQFVMWQFERRETNYCDENINSDNNKNNNSITVAQLIKKWPDLYRTRRFIAVLTTARDWALS
jgi:hypothetical protein